MATKPSDTIESRYPPEEVLSRLEKAFARKGDLPFILSFLGAPRPRWIREGDTFQMHYGTMQRGGMHPAFRATGQVERRGHGSLISFEIRASKLPLVLGGGLILILLWPSYHHHPENLVSALLSGFLFWLVNVWISRPWAEQLRETIHEAAGVPEAN